MTQKIDANITCPEFRLSYPKLFEPEEYKGKKSFSLVALFPSGEDLAEMRALAGAVVIDFFGVKRATELKSAGKLVDPFKDQGDSIKQDDEGVDIPKPGYERGSLLLNFKTNADKGRPGIFDHNRNKIIDPSDIYGGCWCIAAVRCAAYDEAGNTGVGFYLQLVQKLGEGTPFGNRVTAEQAFKKVTKRGHDGNDGGGDGEAGQGSEEVASAASLF